MRLTLSLTAFLMLLIALNGCQAAGDTPEVAQMVSQGERIYQLNCQRCHHPNGEGYRQLFPRLAHNPIVTRHDPTPMIQIVKNGRGAMPGFDAALTNDEIASVLTFIRNSWGNEADPILPEDVR